MSILRGSRLSLLPQRLGKCACKKFGARRVRDLDKFVFIKEGYCTCKVSRVCVASVEIEIWVLNMLKTDGTIVYR